MTNEEQLTAGYPPRGRPRQQIVDVRTEPLEGFEDLTEFELTKAEFKAFSNIQQFLFSVEKNRKAGIIHPQIEEVKELSANYQQLLFTYAKR